MQSAHTRTYTQMLVAAFENNWSCCAGLRLAVVSHDTTDGEATGSSTIAGDPQVHGYFDIGVCKDASKIEAETSHTVEEETTCETSPPTRVARRSSLYRDLTQHRPLHSKRAPARGLNAVLATIGIGYGVAPEYHTHWQEYDVTYSHGDVTLNPHDKSDCLYEKSIRASEAGLQQLSHMEGGATVSIGRAENNDVVLPASNTTISRQHAQFRFAFVSRGWTDFLVARRMRNGAARLKLSVTDLNSTAGTSVFVQDNRGRVYRKMLAPGEVYPLCQDFEQWPKVCPVAPEDLIEQHRALKDLWGRPLTNICPGQRLTIIGLGVGSMAFALQSTRQEYKWTYVRTNVVQKTRSTSCRTERLPCIDQYLDAFLDKEAFVRIL